MLLSTLLLLSSLAQPTTQIKTPDPGPPASLEETPAEVCFEGFSQERFEEAADACLEAVEANPGNVELLQAAAGVLVEADRGEESARCWSQNRSGNGPLSENRIAGRLPFPDHRSFPQE